MHVNMVMEAVMATQARLFPEDGRPTTPPARNPETPAAAASEIYRFAADRVLQLEGHEHEVVRLSKEMTHLRAFARRVSELGGPPSLLAATEDPVIAATALRRPGTSQTTAASWLMTLRLFLGNALGEEEGSRRMAAIEEMMIPRRPKGWDQTNRIPGGRKSQGALDRRVLSMVDLLAIIEKARLGKRGERAVRDHAFVAILCSSGLRMKEVTALCWEDIEWEEVSGGKIFPIWASCRRRGRDLSLPIYKVARGPLKTLHGLTSSADDRTPNGPVFRSIRAPHDQLGYRELRLIVESALRDAGFDGLALTEVRAAFAHHLLTRKGVTEIELTHVLGYGEHKHVRWLLEAHRAMDLNRKASVRKKQKEGAK